VDLAVDNIVFRQIQAPNHDFVADSFNAYRGFHVSGNLDDTFDSDDSYLKYHPGIILHPGEAPVWLVFEGTLASDNPGHLSVQVEDSANTVGLVQSIEMYNWNSGQFDVIESAETTFDVDSVQTIDVSKRIADFVQEQTGAVRSRLGWRQNGVVLVFPWTICLDQVVWTTD
jgi:hypothetical protein